MQPACSPPQGGSPARAAAQCRPAQLYGRGAHLNTGCSASQSSGRESSCTGLPPSDSTSEQNRPPSYVLAAASTAASTSAPKPHCSGRPCTTADAWEGHRSSARRSQRKTQAWQPRANYSCAGQREHKATVDCTVGKLCKLEGTAGGGGGVLTFKASHL
jgi:hypothetical protein